MKDIKLTVVTTTYNRAEVLKKYVFPSLVNQTCVNFKWLIIDDGSLDDTRETVIRFSQEAEFPIEYHWKENGGKHTAINESYKYIKTDFFLILDSDEWLYRDAIKEVVKTCERYKDDPEVGALVWQKNVHSGGFSGKKFPEDEFRSTQIECVINGKIGGEHFTAFRKEVAVKYLFPVFEGERFISEAHLWIGASRQYKFVFLNLALGEFQYFSDGLTKGGRKLRLKNPKGCAYTANLMTMRDIALSIRFKNAILYVSYALIDGRSFKRIFEDSNNKILTVLTFPIGGVVALLWLAKYRDEIYKSK